MQNEPLAYTPADTPVSNVPDPTAETVLRWEDVKDDAPTKTLPTLGSYEGQTVRIHGVEISGTKGGTFVALIGPTKADMVKVKISKGIAADLAAIFKKHGEHVVIETRVTKGIRKVGLAPVGH